MKIVLLFLFICTSVFAKSINIALAANVSYAMPELKKEFNKLYPNTKIRYTIGSSGKLSAQIKNGAPYDIFICANMFYVHKLYKEGLAITKPKIYAKGSLVYLSNKKQDFSDIKELLQNKKIKKIAIANPKTAPYGIAAKQSLKKLNIYTNIKSKLVYGESASQTLAYTLKATDIGLVAKSLLYNKRLKKYKKNINWIEVDSNLYEPINQGIVLLKRAKNKKEAKEFYEFIFYKRAQNIFKKYGYIL